MSTDFPMRRQGDTLVLASPAFLDEFRAIPEDVDLIVPAPRRARHVRQHAWFFAMLTAICESGAWDGDAESLLRWLKLRTNFGDWYPLTSGEAIFVPKSISFASCDQTKFQRFLWYAERALAEHLGVDTDAVFAAIDKSVGEVERLHAQPTSGQEAA